jgi:hypothetical protein
MKTNSALRRILAAGKRGEIISFDYTNPKGETARRSIRVGGDIAKKLERSGTPINGTGSWMTGYSTGTRGMVVIKDGKRYVRGTDTKKSAHRIYLVSQMSNLAIGD